MSSAASGVTSVKVLRDLLEHLGAVVSGELRGHGARLDEGHAHAERDRLLAQRLRERSYPELREVVDAAARASDAAGD